MLRIREQTMRALSGAAARNFEDRVTRHLHEVFPAQCEPLSTGDLVDVVRLAVEKANTYEMRTEHDVVRFIDLMFIFGADFDQSPQYP
jgi:hypothetical protein